MATRTTEVEERAADVGFGVLKGKFQGYSKNPLAGRAERQAKRRAWGVSRKNKSKRNVMQRENANSAQVAATTNRLKHPTNKSEAALLSINPAR